MNARLSCTPEISGLGESFWISVTWWRRDAVASQISTENANFEGQNKFLSRANFRYTRLCKTSKEFRKKRKPKALSEAFRGIPGYHTGCQKG